MADIMRRGYSAGLGAHFWTIVGALEVHGVSSFIAGSTLRDERNATRRAERPQSSEPAQRTRPRML
eukprot:2376260-Amphidinium_carterae.1